MPAFRPGFLFAAFFASLALTSAALPARSPALVAVGVADQTPAMFADARFQALHIEYARLSVPWNALRMTRATPRSGGMACGRTGGWGRPADQLRPRSWQSQPHAA